MGRTESGELLPVFHFVWIILGCGRRGTLDAPPMVTVVVILLYLVVSPVEIIYWRSHPRVGSGTPWNYCISTVIWAGFFYWYLCHKQKAFFAVAAARPNAHS
jgi:hypothetical protein